MVEIAIIIPCYNEELTIGKVVGDCYKHLPEAKVYVVDNNSNDRTGVIASSMGATVLSEPRQGKANALKKAFREINADVYVMIDGDDTYPLDQVDKLIKPIIDQTADMTVGDRHSLGAYAVENKRKFHGFGNQLIKKIINMLFHSKLKDILSGYRAFSKTFVKNYPLICDGFELETDLTIHALHYRYNILEVPITFQDRPKGSTSKLNTFSDGFRIIWLIIVLFKDTKPRVFFSLLAFIIFLVSIGAGSIVIDEFIRTHYITHVPLAILSSSSFILSFLFLLCGFIIDTLVKQDRKNHYLNVIRSMM